MSTVLQINLLSCGHRAYRLPFTRRSIEELMSIRNKDKVKLCIHGEANVVDYWNSYFSSINRLPFNVELFQYANSSYPNRVENAHKTECEYSCKLDDDVLISRYVWDYMIDNLDKITDQNPIIAPILTNGMPTADLFVQDFLSSTDQIEAHRLFLAQPIPNMWGLDYTSINKKIASMKKWCGREYWDHVAVADTHWDKNPVPWHYFNVRGVHPARFSFAYNMFVAHKISENPNKFLGPNSYRLEEYRTPYFTNNIFISKTKYWKDCYYMFNDGWDEGQLSLRMLMDNSAILYVRNGFGIHMAYGMTDKHTLIERMYIENLWKS